MEQAPTEIGEISSNQLAAEPLTIRLAPSFGRALAPFNKTGPKVSREARPLVNHLRVTKGR